MKKYNTIYMLGIKGSGMSSLSAILKKMGKEVWGADVQTREPADALLDEMGITALPFGVENITEKIDLVITTGSHGGLKNPEVLKAQEMGIDVMTHAEALGKVMDAFKTRVAVCGTHGKTTTSSLLAYLFVKMDVPCGYQVGAPSFSGLPGGDLKGYDYFVVESDEYVASPGTDNTPRFMFQNPTHVLCLNIEHDHVDIYKGIEDTKEAFRSFFEKLPQDGALIYCEDDSNSKDVAELVTNTQKYGYGTSEGAFTRVTDISVHNGISNFSVNIDGKDMGMWSTYLSGEHNMKNVSAVLTFLYLKGFDLEEVKNHLASFTGSKRRFEHIYDDPLYSVIDDYAHHPSEIRETIKGARLTYPGRRILVLFQPHTFSRSEAFKHEFGEALGIADQAYILDIYASARETADPDSITAMDLAKNAQEKGHSQVHYLDERNVPEILSDQLQPGDVIITMGATNIFRLHDAILDVITSKKTT